jgi:hypothetical protein
LEIQDHSTGLRLPRPTQRQAVQPHPLWNGLVTALKRANDEGPEVASLGTISRSRARLADRDLDWLLELEQRERERLYRDSEIWAAHRRRLLCVCLGQGSALHLIDGRTGIKDFDLWTFFARRDDLPRRSVDSAFRIGRHRDFGHSRFGARTDTHFRERFPRFEGRNVDIFGVAIPARPRQDPAAAVQSWLSDPPTKRAAYLSQKAFVMLVPRRLGIVWPIEALDQPLRGYLGR